MHPLPYGRQHITDDDVAAVIETLRSDFLTQGPRVAEFEEKFAAYVGARYGHYHTHHLRGQRQLRPLLRR
jgi:dTDP-4-amino-4,6-dideoxygalactose transaminase